MKKNYPVTGKELDFSASSNILSTTNPKGIITYINQDFIDISGFDEEELLGKSHNIVRHPDMPPEAFKDLWANVKKGRPWMGIVKNRCANGDHYWVDAYVTPIHENGQIAEYQSVRRKPERDLVERAKKLYATLQEGNIPKKAKQRAISLNIKLTAGLGVSLLPLLLAATLVPGNLPAIAGAGLLSMGIGAAAVHLLLGPLNTAIGKARALVDNPLMQYIYTGRNDEAGELMLALKMLESETGGIVGRIADSAQTMHKAAEDLQQKAAASGESVAEQFHETEQVATAMAQMVSAIQEVAQNTSEAATSAQQASERASCGKQVVDCTITNINHISKTVENASGVLLGLQQETENIGKILDVIRDIAEQTNLLALNAAIEAARAGEQGRGFAVVADEVRSLANRTQHSTQEIQSMIERLQEGSQNAVKEMENGRSQAQQGVEQVNKAGELLDEINGMVASISDMNTMIASAVEEQSAVASEVSGNVSMIREGAEAVSGNVQQMTEEAKEINERANRLWQLADQFYNK
ncbi:MAG TPA: PAS domain S-box protein [Gammaproteobacteria bacterium]|nr:PAS domain S-box protein [Gammaproteobacteria bacterium]